MRENFSEVADFVTIYIAEVAHSNITAAMLVVIIVVLTIVIMFRLIQRREGTSELEGTVATMTLTPMPTLQTGLVIIMMLGATKALIVKTHYREYGKMSPE